MVGWVAAASILQEWAAGSQQAVAPRCCSPVRRAAARRSCTEPCCRHAKAHRRASPAGLRALLQLALVGLDLGLLVPQGAQLRVGWDGREERGGFGEALGGGGGACSGAAADAAAAVAQLLHSRRPDKSPVSVHPAERIHCYYSFLRRTLLHPRHRRRSDERQHTTAAAATRSTPPRTLLMTPLCMTAFMYRRTATSSGSSSAISTCGAGRGGEWREQPHKRQWTSGRGPCLPTAGDRTHQAALPCRRAAYRTLSLPTTTGSVCRHECTSPGDARTGERPDATAFSPSTAPCPCAADMRDAHWISPPP